MIIKALKICLLTAVISLPPSLVYSQECNFIVNKDKSINKRFISINGLVYVYLPKEKGLELLLKSSKYDLKVDEALILESKISLLTIKLESKQETISVLSKASLSAPTTPSNSFYEGREFSFFMGFLMASSSYFIWKYTR